jgi:hypothetical protein
MPSHQALTSLSWITPDISTNSGFAQDIDIALLYSISHNLGNVMWFSYGTPEVTISPAAIRHCGGWHFSRTRQQQCDQMAGRSFRLIPDISWIADPFTGVVMDLTENDVYPPGEWFAIGGTSVACPMFSGLWAIANQEAGMPLGQAAHYVYSMPSSTITDIVPVGSSTNVTGVITDASGVTSYGRQNWLSRSTAPPCSTMRFGIYR